jgi:hypothetical protein
VAAPAAAPAVAAAAAAAPPVFRRLFPDNLKLSGNSGCNCLSGKELANSLPDKPKSIVYKAPPARPAVLDSPGQKAFSIILLKNQAGPLTFFCGDDSLFTCGRIKSPGVTGCRPAYITK